MSRLCNQCECTNINGTRCHETGCPNQKEQIVLADDGSLDTVFECRGCGETFRFNFASSDDDTDDEDSEDAYDDFVYECLHDLQEDHECTSELWEIDDEDEM